jgi:hypothetical protein
MIVQDDIIRRIVLCEIQPPEHGNAGKRATYVRGGVSRAVVDQCPDFLYLGPLKEFAELTRISTVAKNWGPLYRSSAETLAVYAGSPYHVLCPYPNLVASINL